MRTRDGGCVITFPQGVAAMGSWSWFDDGGLLVAMDSTYLGIAGDWALARFPR